MKEKRNTRRMFGHDYAVPGTYEVTMVVAGRRRVFGEIAGTTRRAGDSPRLVPSVLGRAVLEEEIPKIHHHYPMVDVWQVCLMPDHIHMIIRITRPLPVGKHLGIVVGAFKGGVSHAWWRLCDAAANAATVAPSALTTATPATTVTPSDPTATPSAATPASAATVTAASDAVRRQPLFEPNYNDHILMRDGQLENWKCYLRDNPLRYTLRREYPHLFRRTMCIVIAGVRYSAFGNMLLLRQPEKHQVFFHRRTDGLPTEDTPFWVTESRRLITAAIGGDVLVTPGISECEKRIKNMALKQRLRLIHLQAEPIGPYWKPELNRFEACIGGNLLILAPWQEDMPASASDYERFHYLNRLAATVCAIGHETEVAVQGPRLVAIDDKKINKRLT